jgi:hypothetical protein
MKHPGGRWKCQCENCIEFRREYNRWYRAQNRERINEQNREWYAQNRERIHEHREQNHEHLTEYQRKYRAQNHERINERKREYNIQNQKLISEQRREYREQNHERILAQKSLYREQNHEWLAKKEREWARSSAGKRKYKKYWTKLTEDIPIPNNGKPWTSKDDEFIMRDILIIEACYYLGRSYASVVGRRGYLRRRASESVAKDQPA